jgi:hypothetical protein
MVSGKQARPGARYRVGGRFTRASGMRVRIEIEIIDLDIN